MKIDKQISKKGTKGESGTGLGLIICQEFIKKNNGFIKVNSIIGKGSTFSIHLPFKEGVTTYQIIEEIIEENNNEVLDIEVPKETLLVEPDFLKGMRILIVEDDENIRKTITSTLDEVYELFEAENGEIAWIKALELIPDLIISDVMMPEVDGFELCDKIKQNQLTCHIPFILLTARLSDSSQIEGLKLGADDYLTKPFDSKILRYKVRNILVTREKLKKKFKMAHSMRTDLLTTSIKDEEFINKLCEYLASNIENNEISVNDISDYLGISRGHFYRKVMGVSGLSPQDFIRIFRLKKGAELLKNKHFSAKEVSFKVGFSNPNYFYRAFKNQFGISTSEYLHAEEE